MAYFKALNYEVHTADDECLYAEADHDTSTSMQVSAAEDVITFKGVMGRSNSQAYFLTFCTFVGK